MTYDDFVKYLRQPETLISVPEKELKELAEKYPYFKLAKWLYLKSLYLSNSIYQGQELKKTALYASNRRNLYYYIHPDELNVNEPFVLRNESTGGYFDMLNRLDSNGENNRLSLQSLAEKLRAARESLKSEPESKSESKEKPVFEHKVFIREVPVKFTEKVQEVIMGETFEENEKRAKQLIREKKYSEAIEILEGLNLINPKKSIYFADQIRFLKKIIRS